MIKCKVECPNGNFDGCCFFCTVNGCRNKCTKAPSDCEDVVKVKDEVTENSEEKALAQFKQNQIDTLNKIKSLIVQKKAIEDAESKLKKTLQEGMEQFGIKKFTSDILNITYVAATTSTSIDSTKLKKKYPDIAAECSKTANKKAYIKVEVK